MNIKKGFTIVELAIALVVIGLILTMTLQGMELVVETIGRKEVNKIGKIEVAMATYYARNLKTAPNIEALVRGQLISEKDIKIEWAAIVYLVPKNKLELTRVRYFSVPTYTWYTNTISGTTGSSMAALSANGYLLSARYVCFIEKIRDDLTLQNGRGRGFSAYDLPADVYNDCASQDPSAVFVNSSQYAYTVMDPKIRSKQLP